MFRFGFADPASTQHAAEPGPAEQGQGAAAGAPVDTIGAEEVLDSEGQPTGSQESVAVSAGLTLIKGIVSNTQAASLLADDRVAANDLIAGVYEGGFKTWEGGLDLAQLLAAALQQQPPPAELGPGSRVMELGCGSGLPGLVALWAGAEVHFQDYNRSVITRLTMQNVAANASAWSTRQQAATSSSGQGSGGAAGSAGGTGAASRARYFAGSWEALPGLLAERGLHHSYDLVLTAETIYSLEAIQSLYRCIKACLRPTAGVAYVAAKSYYFGVGGGTAAFRNVLEADGCFECQLAAVVDDGQSNKRELLRLTPRQPAA